MFTALQVMSSLANTRSLLRIRRQVFTMQERLSLKHETEKLSIVIKLKLRKIPKQSSASNI